MTRSGLAKIVVSGLLFVAIYNSIPASTKSTSNVPANYTLNEMKPQSEWSAQIRMIEAFDVKKQSQDISVDTEESSQDNKAPIIVGIENVRLIGVLETNEPQALIVIDSQETVRNVKLKDLLFEQWELVEISDAKITWQNISNQATHTLELFE